MTKWQKFKHYFNWHCWHKDWNNVSRIGDFVPNPEHGSHIPVDEWLTKTTYTEPYICCYCGLIKTEVRVTIR